ncbi:MAG: hypothetical protein A2161_11525 [Candidatus Schekmanbacteria bacterium RBG_13_48_7]|uniref:DUF177 domain-containing protein n=1 Tax=Candidatus Schekmanbacteria bacterium RBG_13_48_7 TaxID=1817878 RepID=A0A1F7RXN9_9BACT|nr:MAG: hypothetical protein A2161_11525 [Candidatus Schekmanbacteria bacterium RBG_13_48_7]
MKIPVSNIRDSAVESDFTEDWSVFESKGKVDFHPNSLIKGHFLLLYLEDQVLLRMDFQVELIFSCARCSELFPLKLDRHVEMLLYPGSLEAKMLDLDILSADIDFYKNDVIDISDYIWEEIVLNVPMKPLCSEECLGLCSICGTNLNNLSCDCSREVVDSRWLDLQKLKEKLSS